MVRCSTRRQLSFESAMAREKIVCECGGELTRPIPHKCPHCGAIVAAVRQRLWPRVFPVLLVGSLFTAMIVYLWWLLNK